MWPMGEFGSVNIFGKNMLSATIKIICTQSILHWRGSTILSQLSYSWTGKWLVGCAPSISPENSPVSQPGSSIAQGQLSITNLFSISSPKPLKLQTAGTAMMLLPIRWKMHWRNFLRCQIGRFGQLQERMHDWDNPDDKHRHVSHLYGLYPSEPRFRHTELLSYSMQPEHRCFIVATLPTGWSMNWKINLWARLLDGNHVLELIKMQISPARIKETTTFTEKEGHMPICSMPIPRSKLTETLVTSGVAEVLLLESRQGITPLPALPDGQLNELVTGLRGTGDLRIVQLHGWKVAK